MKAHVRIHGYLPLLFALLLAALPGVIVAYGLYPEIIQKCINDLLREVNILFMGSSSITAEEGTRGRSSSTSSTSRPRSSSQSRHASPSPSPPKKHITMVEENHHHGGSSSSSASTSSSSRRKSTAATTTSMAVKESKTPKPDRRHSMLPSAPTTGVKNDRKSVSKSNGKSTKTQAAAEEEEEEEERLRIAAEMDVYKGTRSKTPMKRK